MNQTPARTATAPGQAEAALSVVRQEVAQARAELADARTELALVRMAASAATLVEANEKLLLSCLEAQTLADASAQAVRELGDAIELDALTGLPTPALLRARLALAMATAGTEHRRVALLALNLADFSLISDKLGHAVGDRVLQLASRSLCAAVRPIDSVSRLGGSEFLVLLSDVGDGSDAVALAAAIVAALGAPKMLDKHVLRLAADVGISIYPDDSSTADGMIERAATAMSRAKRRDRADDSGSECSLELRAVDSLRPPLVERGTAIADQEKRHEHLQQANTQLVLAALGAQDLQAAAELALRRQTDFLGVVAHELRSPLAPISNAAALLGRLATNAPVLAKVQAIIARQVNNMSRLIEDLLDVSRVNTGKLGLRMETLAVGELLNEVMEACRPAMDTRLQSFEVYFPEGDLQIDGDPQRLTQVLTNLLDNASKYTPAGGHIRFSATRSAEKLELAVTDNGIGITPEAAPTIFEPFIQEQHATLFNGAGLGIGLTVVRALVEGHNGQITAASAGKGLGSVFTVTLPLRRAAAQA